MRGATTYCLELSPPLDYYRGHPAAVLAERKRKLKAAALRRKEVNRLIELTKIKGGCIILVVEGLGGAYGVERVSLGRRDFVAPFREEVIEYRGADRSWEEEWWEMQRAIWEQRQPAGNGWDGLRAMELAEALYRSAREKRVIILEAQN